MSMFKDLIKNYSKTTKRLREEEPKPSSSSKQKVSDDSRSRESSSTSSRDQDSSDGPPHFLIIGAQKAGTMAAVKNLNKHSEIYVKCEAHFFDLAWHYSKAIEKYRNSLASEGVGKKMIGEKTPEYIYVDDCAGRIKEVCPNAKFIFFIRDPIKRAFSSWNMRKSKGEETSPFDMCVEQNMKNLNEHRSFGTAEYHYVQRGFYLEQIQRFMKTFPNRDNLLIIVAEHAMKNPQAEYNKIFDFLGVRRETLDFEDDHIGSYTAPMTAATSDKLRRIYHDHNDRLFEFLGHRIPEWDK